MSTHIFYDVGVNEESYIRSDLAMERHSAAGCAEGVEHEESRINGITLTRIRVTSEAGQRAVGRPRGNYVTLGIGRPWLMGRTECERVEALLSREIVRMAEPLCDCRSVLICGLGNRGITVDALGPEVTDDLIVTRHVKLHERELFESLFECEVAALSPGVLAQTGIETLELVRGAVERVRPSLVVVIDALAARSVDRLMTTLQLCDTGIAPGSGIGNRRCAVDRAALGVPVIAVGVPTVVSSATLIGDALELCGLTERSPEIRKVLENGRSYFVSVKESDAAVRTLSGLIARALNRAFGSAAVM